MKQNKISFLNPLTGEPLCQQEIDEMFMRRCLQLAKNGRQNAKPNPMRCHRERRGQNHRRGLSCKMWRGAR